MNDEIKEILEGIEVVIKHDGTLEFNAKELKILLDYITNLKEENERLLKKSYKDDVVITKAVDYIKNHTIEWVDEQFEVHNVMVAVDEYFNPEHVIWLLNGGDE